NARTHAHLRECRVRWRHAVRLGHITGGGLLVARQTIDYLVPVMYGPELTMTVPVKKLGNSSFTVNTRGDQDGRQVFDHDRVLVHIDRASPKPTPRTPELRAAFQRYLPA